jgi:hypothetical protein
MFGKGDRVRLDGHPDTTKGTIRFRIDAEEHGQPEGTSDMFRVVWDGVGSEGEVVEDDYTEDELELVRRAPEYPRWQVRKFAYEPGQYYEAIGSPEDYCWEVVYRRSPEHEPYVSRRVSSWQRAMDEACRGASVSIRGI